MAEPTPRHAAEAALRSALLRVAELHAERGANPTLAVALTRLADWQSRRLGRTYSDLAADPRYADAVRFFQEDLYGPADYTRRDSDVARVVPMLVGMLPERVIATVAAAMELNALSHELDRHVLRHLGASARFSVADYCRAFRQADDAAARRRQIELILEVGGALDQYVRKPLIRAALRMMHGPAHLAGFGAIHDFLERGFDAFARMRGAGDFLETIATREQALLDAIMRGSDAPFPDPLDASDARPPEASG